MARVTNEQVDYILDDLSSRGIVLEDLNPFPAARINLRVIGKLLVPVAVVREKPPRMNRLGMTSCRARQNGRIQGKDQYRANQETDH